MDVTIEELRARMAERHSYELREIARNRDRLYTVAAVEAAAAELAVRPQLDDRDTDWEPSVPVTAPIEETWFTRGQFWLKSLPGTVRSALWFGLAVAIISSVAVFVPSSSHNLQAWGFAAALAWLTVIGILREHPYVYPVLIATGISIALFEIENMILERSFWSVARSVVLLWYCWSALSDNEVLRYYRRLRQESQSSH